MYPPKLSDKETNLERIGIIFGRLFASLPRIQFDVEWCDGSGYFRDLKASNLHEPACSAIDGHGRRMVMIRNESSSKMIVWFERRTAAFSKLILLPYGSDDGWMSGPISNMRIVGLESSAAELEVALTEAEKLEKAAMKMGEVHETPEMCVCGRLII